MLLAVIDFMHLQQCYHWLGLYCMPLLSGLNQKGFTCLSHYTNKERHLVYKSANE